MIDQLDLQLVWNRLLAIVEEQAQTLMRTAFSTVVREAGDLSAGVFSPAGDMLAQAVTGTPGHVNSMALAVAKFIAKYPVATLSQGDVLLTNDPWDGTGHLNDFTVVTPIFLEEMCVALFASTSHIADVGGRGFGADAHEVFEEGINIPIGFLFKAGEANELLLEIIAANVRDPLVAKGDLYSLTACNHNGGLQLLEMMADFGLNDLAAVGTEIIARSKQAMITEIQGLPQGEYSYQMVVDGYDEPIELQCRVALLADSIEVDFAGSAGKAAMGINVPLAYTQAYASFGVRCVVGGDIPNNAGSLSVIRVTAPVGSLLNAVKPAAVSARHAVGQMLPDAVLGCLAQVIPDQIPAEGASCIWNPVFLSAQESAAQESDDSRVSANARPFVINPIFNGGTGARPGKDGLSTTAFPSGVRTTSTEVNEVTSDLVVWRKEYLTDSGGAGEFRGGLGQVVELGHRWSAGFWVSKMFDRVLNPARGRAGGLAGSPGAVYTQPALTLSTESNEPIRVILKTKGKELVPAGRNLVLETPGGGGIGDPARRTSTARQADLRSGLVSVPD